MFGRKKQKRDEDRLTPLEINSGQIDLAPGLQNLYCPTTVTTPVRTHDLADMLLEIGLIDQAKYDSVRQDQQKSGGDLEKLLLKAMIDQTDILKAKARLFGHEFRSIRLDDVDKEAFKKLELNYIRTNNVLPIACQDGILTVATSNPANVFSIDDVRRQTGLNVDIIVCCPEEITAICDELDESKFDYNVDEIMNDMDEVELVQENEEQGAEDLEKSAGESPVIKFVNYLLTNALHEGASDIHIEPKEKRTIIRYRIDGVLFESTQAPAKMHPALVSRLKIMANLDISERRIPQDGKIAVIMGGRGIDLRISILPTSHGEKVVIRLLDSKSIMIGLEQTGMETELLKAFQEQIALPHGILLVTGPTGSGKSTTLYSALAQMNSSTLNVSTVEDPVEYNLEFCNQVQVNEKAGLTFSAALRSLLRQDPDIIMMGEIRDNETARIAVQAALTGHLVLSTLHTNDAPSSVSRLVNIGIEPYLLAASLNGILAQRLVRRVCKHCKEPDPNYPEQMRVHLERAGIEPGDLMRGRGCDQCRNSGYAGRMGIHELLIIDEHFRKAMDKNCSVSNMRKTFNASGWPNLFQDGLKKVKAGETTIEEILRVTEVADAADDDVTKTVKELELNAPSDTPCVTQSTPVEIPKQTTMPNTIKIEE